MIVLWFQGKGAEGRGRRAQLRRRMLMVDVENAVMTCQMSVDEGQVSSEPCIFDVHQFEQTFVAPNHKPSNLKPYLRDL